MRLKNFALLFAAVGLSSFVKAQETNAASPVVNNGGDSGATSAASVVVASTPAPSAQTVIASIAQTTPQASNAADVTSPITASKTASTSTTTTGKAYINYDNLPYPESSAMSLMSSVGTSLVLAVAAVALI